MPLCPLQPPVSPVPPYPHTLPQVCQDPVARCPLRSTQLRAAAAGDLGPGEGAGKDSRAPLQMSHHSGSVFLAGAVSGARQSRNRRGSFGCSGYAALCSQEPGWGLGAGGLGGKRAGCRQLLLFGETRQDMQWLAGFLPVSALLVNAAGRLRCAASACVVTAGRGGTGAGNYVLKYPGCFPCAP